MIILSFAWSLFQVWPGQNWSILHVVLFISLQRCWANISSWDCHILKAMGLNSQPPSTERPVKTFPHRTEQPVTGRGDSPTPVPARVAAIGKNPCFLTHPLWKCSLFPIPHKKVRISISLFAGSLMGLWHWPRRNQSQEVGLIPEWCNKLLSDKT